MPAVATYQPNEPTMAATQIKQLPLRSAATTKDTTEITLCTSVPLSRPVGSTPAQSVAGSSAVPSLTNGSSSASSAAGTDHVDLITLMGDRLAKVADPIPMDRSLVKQAQASGELNAKNQELEELRAMLARRTKAAKKNFAEGIKAAKEVKKDLEWTQNQIANLNIKAAEKHADAFKAASSNAGLRAE